MKINFTATLLERMLIRSLAILPRAMRLFVEAKLYHRGIVLRSIPGDRGWYRLEGDRL